jgi:hypothetical protein
MGCESATGGMSVNPKALNKAAAQLAEAVKQARLAYQFSLARPTSRCQLWRARH